MSQLKIVALGEITQKAGKAFFPRFGGSLKDTLEPFPAEYLEKQKEHPVKFWGDIFWAFKDIVVQVLNYYDAKSDYEVSTEVAHFVVNYLKSDKSKRLLSQLVPFGEYIEMGNDFMMETASPSDKSAQFKDWFTKALTLICMGVRISSKEEEAQVNTQREAMRKLALLALKGLHNNSSKEDLTVATWFKNMFLLFENLDIKGSTPMFSFEEQSALV